MFGYDRVHVCIPGMLTRFLTLPEEEGWEGSGMANRHKVCTWAQWRRGRCCSCHICITSPSATWNAGAPNTEHPPFRALGVSSRTPTPLTRPLTTQLLHNPSLGPRWSFLPPYDRLRLLDMFPKSRGKFSWKSFPPQFLCTILFLTLINPFSGISCFNNTVA